VSETLEIASVEAWLVRLPLPRPIHFSSGTWEHWNYVVVRLQTRDGREAGAYTYLGEIPIDLMVTELVAPRVVGLAPADLRPLAERWAEAVNPPLRDVVRPAASLVEVCLWDLSAQAAGIPLWRALCEEPARRTADVMLVEHRRDGDTPQTFADRVAAMKSQGVRAVKLKHYGDLEETAARLAAIRAATTDLELVLDVGWMWTDVASALDAARVLGDYDLAWIEDPFPPFRVAEAAHLRRAIDIPIGIGDAVTSVDLAERLIREDAVDVLRVDVTTMGGIAGVERLAELADASGVGLSPEILAEVHQHIAFAWPAVRGVEIYSPDSGVWSGDVFVRPSSLTLDGPGRVRAPEDPGSGLQFDWEAVERHAVRRSSHPAR
jgi:L-alanine-DL-glutamate epimerase-like enolase superfamily enzyme